MHLAGGAVRVACKAKAPGQFEQLLQPRVAIGIAVHLHDDGADVRQRIDLHQGQLAAFDVHNEDAWPVLVEQLAEVERRHLDGALVGA